MGLRLRMTAELGDWLAGLSESEPLTAAEVGAALVAVLAATDPSDLGIVRSPGPAAEPVQDPREIVDHAYQQQLDQLQHIRRQLAAMTEARQAAALALSEQQAAGADAAVIAALAERQAAAHLREDAFAQLRERTQLEVDAFRTAKETAKARYTAAEATLRIAEAIEAIGGEPDPDLDQRRADYRAARERLHALRYPATETIAVIHEPAERATAGHPPPAGPAEPPRLSAARVEPTPGLLELRADPVGSDVRILFAEEPAGTVTLLAVLEGAAALSEHGADAIRLAGDLLTEVRGDDWPADLTEVALADTAEFVARFFPADDGSIEQRAGVLGAMTSPGRLRADLHLSLGELAARSGLLPHRVEAIELDGLRTAHVHEAVALARALGARLELSAGAGPVMG